MTKILAGFGLGPILAGLGLGILQGKQTFNTLQSSVRQWAGLKLSDVSPGNLTAWWDAGTLDGMLDYNNTIPVFWGGYLSGLIDKSGNSNPVTFRDTTGPFTSNTGMPNPPTTPVVSQARMCGDLGAAGAWRLSANALSRPQVYEAQSSTPTNNINMSASVAWSFTVVFSRPNLAQNVGVGNASGAQVVLTNGATTVLGMLNNTTSDTLKLFPNGANITLATGMTRAFTCSITLVNHAGTGVDVYYNDALVASNVANPIIATNSLGLPSGANGQTVFHEAGYWNVTLTSGAIVNLHTAANGASKRWLRSNGRKCPIFIPYGQSNASDWIAYGLVPYSQNTFTATGEEMLNEAIRYHLGALGCWVIRDLGGSFTGGGGNTIDPTGNGFLIGDGTDPVAANDPLGNRGTLTQSGIASLGVDQQQNIAGIFWPYSEGATVGSSYTYTKTIYARAADQVTRRLRLTPNVGALPLFLTPIPYNGSNDAQQGIVEGFWGVAADPTANAVIMLTNILDTNPLGALYDPVTGIFTVTGDAGLHRDRPDWVRMSTRAGPLIAHALVTQGISSDLAAWPTGLVTFGGPNISAAHYEGITQGRTNGGTATDTVLVTVQHDPGYASIGADFYINSLTGNLGYIGDGVAARDSAAYAGFMIMDGGTGPFPAATVLAISVERVDATHLRVILASRISSTSQANLALAKLYYGWGCTGGAGSVPRTSQFGRGNAIYDNYAYLPKPAGFNFASDYGYVENNPLAVTPNGVVFT